MSLRESYRKTRAAEDLRQKDESERRAKKAQAAKLASQIAFSDAMNFFGNEILPRLDAERDFLSDVGVRFVVADEMPIFKLVTGYDTVLLRVTIEGMAAARFGFKKRDAEYLHGISLSQTFAEEVMAEVGRRLALELSLESELQEDEESRDL